MTADAKIMKWQKIAPARKAPRAFIFACLFVSPWATVSIIVSGVHPNGRYFPLRPKPQETASLPACFIVTTMGIEQAEMM